MTTGLQGTTRKLPLLSSEPPPKKLKGKKDPLIHMPVDVRSLSSVKLSKVKVAKLETNSDKRLKVLKDFCPKRKPREFFPEVLVDSKDIKDVRSLGKGRAGVVLKFRLEGQEEEFAIKVPGKDVALAWGPNYEGKELRTVSREPHIACYLPSHPNIIRAHHLIPLKNTKTGKTVPCLVMDYFPGSIDLVDLVKHPYLPKLSLRVSNPEARKQRIANIKIAIMDMVNALEHMHKNNIAYRDLKPENMLLVPFQRHFRIVYVDLGFARDPRTKSGLPKDLEKNTDGYLSDCGTEMYLSPELIEQTQEKRRAKYRAFSNDLWSLGATIYAIASEISPIPTSFWKKDLKNLSNDELLAMKKTPLDWYPKLFPEELKNLIGALMHTDPKKRPTFSEIKSHPFLNEKREG